MTALAAGHAIAWRRTNKNEGADIRGNDHSVGGDRMRETQNIWDLYALYRPYARL